MGAAIACARELGLISRTRAHNANAAAEVTGQKFYYLRNSGALLELALVSWALARVGARGFLPLTTPDLVKASVLEKCGFQPRGTNTQVCVWCGLVHVLCQCVLYVCACLVSVGVCCVFCLSCVSGCVVCLCMSCVSVCVCCVLVHVLCQCVLCACACLVLGCVLCVVHVLCPCVCCVLVHVLCQWVCCVLCMSCVSVCVCVLVHVLCQRVFVCLCMSSVSVCVLCACAYVRVSFV